MIHKRILELLVAVLVATSRVELTSEHSDIDSTVLWTVASDSGQPCILASFEPSFTLNYTYADSLNKTVSTSINLDTTNSTQTARGNCSDSTTQDFTLTVSSNYSLIELTITFQRKVVDADNDYWFSSHLKLALTNVTIPRLNAHINLQLNDTDVSENLSFGAVIGSSYSCNAGSNVSLLNSAFPTVVKFRNVRIQAFASDAHFGPVTICRRDIDVATAHDNVLIPVVVGVCLLIVVIITVVVYAARKIVKQTQYNSMD